MQLDVQMFATAACEARIAARGPAMPGYLVEQPGAGVVLVTDPNQIILIASNSLAPYTHTAPAWELYFEEAMNFIAFSNVVQQAAQRQSQSTPSDAMAAFRETQERANGGDPDARYGANWLKAQVAEHGYTRLIVRQCSICSEDIGYVFQDGLVGYDSSCGCCEPSPIKDRTYFDVADYLKQQPDDSARDVALEGFR